MKTLGTDSPEFSIGPLMPLPGLEGESLAVSGGHIALLSSSEAQWLEDSVIRKVELPNVIVDHARWSEDGTRIFIGTGVLDLKNGVWRSLPQLEALHEPPPPGEGGLTLKRTSWSRDGHYLAALLDWSGPIEEDVELPRVLVYNLKKDTLPVEIIEEDVSDIRIINEQLVLMAPEVSVWTLSGKQVGRLSPTPGSPFRLSVNASGTRAALLDNDRSVRLVDASRWSELARWDGSFADAIPLENSLIGIDLEGRLHAVCTTPQGLKSRGTIETGLLAANLAITDDGRLVFKSAGPVAVHAAKLKLQCE